MKKVILIVLLSFVALSCSKDASEPKEEEIADTHIKNDIPDELVGKWKEIAQREISDYGGEWHISVSGQKYDWDFKEYSICCSSETEQDCDTYFVSTFANKITITACDSDDDYRYKYISYFQLLKGNLLILGGAGIDTGIETKYVKVE